MAAFLGEAAQFFHFPFILIIYKIADFLIQVLDSRLRGNDSNKIPHVDFVFAFYAALWFSLSSYIYIHPSINEIKENHHAGYRTRLQRP